MRDISVTPFFGYKTVVCLLTSWNESRSPVHMATEKPSRSADFAKVAIKSSAS